MEPDALGVMLLGLIAWQHHLVAAWVLAAGLWRYAYAALIAVVPGLGEAPRSRFGRVIFIVLMLCLIGMFLPVAGVATPLAATGTVLVSLSFIYSLVRSGSAPRAAESDPARRGRFAA